MFCFGDLVRSGATFSTILAACLAIFGGPAEAQVSGEFNSTRPAIRIEYWQKRISEIEQRLSVTESLEPIKVVFIGDSITDFWTMGDNPWFPGAVGGLSIWNESFDGGDPVNRGLNLGISGDRTEHVLYRILPASDGGLGELDRSDLDPDVIVLLIGINNSWDAETPVVNSVVSGIRAVTAAVHERKPDALIVLQSLLPTNEPRRNEEVVVPVNAALAAFASENSQAAHVRFLDINPVFLDERGEQNPAFFMDGVHPNERGYRAWRDRLIPFLAAMRQ
jgi:lysophospholipase L1-like esterase